MKCFTIQSGNEYIADVSRVITKSWYEGVNLESVDCDDEAKHYKSYSQANTWLKNTTARIKIQVDKEQQKLNTHLKHKSWQLASSKRLVKTLKTVNLWLLKAKVIELDMEKPNFLKDNRITWDKWRVHNGTAGKSSMSVQKVSHSRYICKSCGLKLKNIPFYDMKEGNSTKICIPCLYIRLDNIKSAFEGMDEEFRTSIVNELILGSL